ncbi:hypothetical protein NHX12_004563 [Muraenolepis orangiensis]|uniref:Uncharacterized protein n=1 Tax=Muraenolepis orangiensis TaxID=630683 RepID=A0A9Q0DVH6_9TELE|nr:hypothetical protein NHX12_004563 [Muraenolepis orangiensis]
MPLDRGSPAITPTRPVCVLGPAERSGTVAHTWTRGRPVGLHFYPPRALGFLLPRATPLPSLGPDLFCSPLLDHAVKR